MLLANEAIMLNTLNDYRQASDHTAANADDYRALTERHRSVADRYRSSTDRFAHALGNDRDIPIQVVTPDDMSCLDDIDPAE